jgi:hypothetical protein
MEINKTFSEEFEDTKRANQNPYIEEYSHEYSNVFS